MQVAINGLVSTNNCTKCAFFSLLCRCGATATVGIIKQKHARLVVRTCLATNWAVTILSDSSGGTNMTKTRLVHTKGLPVPRSSAIPIQWPGTSEYAHQQGLALHFWPTNAVYGHGPDGRRMALSWVWQPTALTAAALPSALCGFQKWRHSCTSMECCISSGSTSSSLEIPSEIFVSAWHFNAGQEIVWRLINDEWSLTATVDSAWPCKQPCLRLLIDISILQPPIFPPNTF